MRVFQGTITEVYDQLIRMLLSGDENSYEHVIGTREMTNVCLDIINPTLENIRFPHRNVSEKYSNAELRWYWSGDNSCKTIGQHASMWLRLSDDGETNNSAYGYILHKKHNKDQLDEVIRLLKADKYSRKAVLSITDPKVDKLTTKDFQCTIALQFLVRNDELTMTVYMRSNDVYFGLPYDYIYFTSIGQYVTEQLGIPFVNYQHCVTSMHMYDRDVQKFEREHGQTFTIDAKSIIKEYYNESK